MLLPVLFLTVLQLLSSGRPALAGSGASCLPAGRARPGKGRASSRALG